MYDFFENPNLYLNDCSSSGCTSNIVSNIQCIFGLVGFIIRMDILIDNVTKKSLLYENKNVRNYFTCCKIKWEEEKT